MGEDQLTENDYIILAGNFKARRPEVHGGVLDAQWSGDVRVVALFLETRFSNFNHQRFLDAIQGRSEWDTDIPGLLQS